MEVEIVECGVLTAGSQENAVRARRRLPVYYEEGLLEARQQKRVYRRNKCETHGSSLYSNR